MFEKTREYLNSLSKEELKETLLKLGFQVNLMYADFIQMILIMLKKNFIKL